MTELKLGNKYECFNCSAKFYDLGKGAAVCPKCGSDQSEAEEKENPLVSQSVRRRRRAELQPDAAAGGDDDDDEIVLPEDDAVIDEDLELDTEGLEDDEEEDDDDDEA